MVNERNDKSQIGGTERLKEITKWTQRYAENRTLPFLISMITCLFISAAVGVPSYFGGKAYRSGNMALFGLCVSLLTLVSVALIFFSFTKWDEKFTDRISRRLYGSEGMVTLAIPKKTKRQRRAGWIAGLLFGVCVMISVILVVFCKIPIKYMQPVSAICVIPLIIAIGIWQPPSVKPAGFLVWLWPTLYAIHAILIVAGIPIHFERPWIFLNILIPIVGYGILCGLIGHVYSRYALKKLKGLTRLEGDAANGD